MEMLLHGQVLPLRRLVPPKLFRIMRSTAILLLTTALHVSAKGYSQNITLSYRHITLEKAFRLIEKQTDYSFLWNQTVLDKMPPVDIEVRDAPLTRVLDSCLKGLPLTYKIKDKVVLIEMATPPPPNGGNVSPPAFIDLSGKVANEKGEPLAGATVMVKGTSSGSSTNGEGIFRLKQVSPKAILIISFTGYITQEVVPGERSFIAVTLAINQNSLDQTVVIAYGTTTKRMNPGDVSKVTSQEIEAQPVANPLAALEGRVPGLFITQSTGFPGSGFSVQIRGQNSISNGNAPLYIVDGVPFNANTLDRIQAGPITQQSPLSSINPLDIESIEILKDADATAIYGSRGANGVVLITTKKGRAGKTRLDMNVYSGEGAVTRMIDFLNTPQYLQVRREAFRNDGIAMNATNAYDLLSWDTTRYTNWEKMLIGGTAHITDAQATLSGGNYQTQFLLGANYHHETTVFPGNLADNRGDVHLNVTNHSADNRLSATVSVSYSSDLNHLVPNDVTGTGFINIAPDAPRPYDSTGHLVWYDHGINFSNPLGYLSQTYSAQTDNLIGNANLGYNLLPGLTIRASTGYTYTQLNQVATYPKASQNPALAPTAHATFGTNSFKSYILEPQAEYVRSLGKGKLDLLAGASWQQEVTNGNILNAGNYNSDALLQSTAGAGSITSRTNYTQYRYQSFFGRINYIWQNKYVLDLTGRRDGSSRFGPANLYANFGAVGAAWIFSEESLIRSGLPWLSFGKLRGSYGTSGNDQIGDYRYLSTWSATVNPYLGTAGLQPTALYNPDYAWEVNRKLEAALDLGFLRNRILVSANFFRNKSSNQLVNYTLPSQTGFSGITANLPALVQNEGWEFQLNTENIKTKAFRWTTSFNLTLSRNKLLKFPGLAASSYVNTYVIGQPLNIRKVLHFTGVDPKTGLYTYSGTSIPTNETSILDFTPAWYGGISNHFSYKGFDLDFLFQFVKQKGYQYNALAAIVSPPGTIYNQPVQDLNRWQQQGDEKPVQKYSTGPGGNIAAYLDNVYFTSSDGMFGDASFIRLKNLSLSWTLPPSAVRSIKAETVKLFVQGQNLLTMTHYFGFDPENQTAGLPPLRVLTAGFRASF